MGVEIKTAGQKLFAFLSGELDHHTAKEMRCEIDIACTRELPKELYLDFSKITFMDSSGIGLVMGRYKLMCERKGRVYIQNPPPAIRRVMQVAGISRLARMIERIDTPEETSPETAVEATAEASLPANSVETPTEQQI